MTRPKSHQPTLLIVDDEQSILEVIGRLAEEAGFEVVPCPGGPQALEYLQHHRADVAAVDLRMPDVGGLEVLRAIREADPDCQVVLMSGEATIDSAVKAVKLGAIDYLTKPFDFARVRNLLKTVREDVARRRRLLDAEHEVAKNAEFCGMVGLSPVMQELFGLIRRLAPHVRTVLITGETGSGKELVARAFHRMGPRRSKPFVTINCSAVVETLFESELFGHARGAFTGATENKPGLFEVANTGTLFLDEIGELPHVMQAKLLRVLETGEVQRVGAVEPRHVDVHVLAATNRDLRAEASEGRYRSDLYYRLNVVDIRVPPLRERREDIPFLVAAFVRECAARLGKRLVGSTPSLERRLIGGNWEGNVRELRNAIERACILAEGEFITEREFVGRVSQSLPSRTPAFNEDQPAASERNGTLSALEREHIVEVLARVGGNKAKAAQILGLDRRSLYRRLEMFGIGTINRRRREIASV
jgi:DNA-binding NtrC family response regulator